MTTRLRVVMGRIRFDAATTWVRASSIMPDNQPLSLGAIVLVSGMAASWGPILQIFHSAAGLGHDDEHDRHQTVPGRNVSGLRHIPNRALPCL